MGVLRLAWCFSHEGETWHVEATLQALDQTQEGHRGQIISRFESRFDGKTDLVLEWDLKASRRENRAIYRVSTREGERQETVTFKGILPVSPSHSARTLAWFDRARAYAQQLVHIGPVRDTGKRYFTRAEGKPEKMVANGANAPHILEKSDAALPRKGADVVCP